MELEYRWNERRMLCDHFQSDGKQKPERGVLELQAFLMAARQSAWKDWIEEV
jgi:hypothetical protein